MFRKTILTATTAIFAAGAAAAQTTAYATTDLNLRAGPGPHYQVLDVIAGQDAATVDGCLETTDWCKVAYNGTEGWAYSAYLASSLDAPLPIIGEEAPETVTVRTVTYEEPNDAGGAAGAAAGMIAGALIGGPAAVAAGMVLGATTGAMVDPKETTVTYVTSNPVEPVYVKGEVVTGAVIPAEVTLYEVPDSDYHYVVLNETTVLVEPDTRKIVYIVR